jgi:hypothetical protein
MNTHRITTGLPREEQDILALIGINLISVQVTEENLGFCINFVFRSGPVITLEGIDALEEDARRKTLGQLIRGPRQAVAVPPSFEQELQSLLDNRNRFIHHLRHDTELNMDHPEGRKNLRIFLVRFCDQMLSMNSVFLGFLATFAADVGIVGVPEAAPCGNLISRVAESADWKLVINRKTAE